MSIFSVLVIVHALVATVWTGGHLVLDLGVLPKALREQSAQHIRDFEEMFEPLGLTALAIQVGKLVELELLDRIAKAESQGKSRQEQCIEADYATHIGTPNIQAFDDAVNKAKRHVEIIRTGSLHPFLLHCHTKTPVSRQNKHLNAPIEELSSLVSLSYIDGLEEDLWIALMRLGTLTAISMSMISAHSIAKGLPRSISLKNLMRIGG